MATYVNDLRLKEIATGDESGTWGTSTNTNLSLIADAFSYATKDCFATDADATETMADGSADEIRSLYLKVTSSATLTATRTLTLAPNTVSKVWIIENATTGSQSISISQGSGANVTIPNGDVKVIYTDGAGATAAVTDAFTDLNVGGTLTATNLAGTLTTAAQTNITSVGALDGGSITSGFGSIDVGSSAITTTGTVTGTTLAGTLSTAAQTNITSVGTLSSLTVSGDLTVDTNTLYVDSANNRVGIGTTSPALPLHVYATGGNLARFTHNTATPTTTYITAVNANDTSNGTVVAHISDGTSYIGNQQNAALRLVTNDTERMRIDSSGLVGIGTSSLSVGRHLTIGNATAPAQSFQQGGTEKFLFGVSGTVNGGVTGSASGDFFARTTGGKMLFSTDDGVTAHAVINSSGNVGIGTSSFNATYDPRLQVTSAANDGTGGILIQNYLPTLTLEDISGGAAASQIQQDQTNMLFKNNGSERMRIDSSGNVGIGTSSPSHLLELVRSSTDFGPTLEINNTSSANGSTGSVRFVTENESTGFVMGKHSNGFGTPDLAFINQELNSDLAIFTNNTERMRITSAGNVGIGTTSPSTKLHVTDSSGSAYEALTVQSSNASSDVGISLIGGGGSNFRLQQPYNADGLFFYDVTNAAERMRIDSSGNVGIGTTSPDTLLNLESATPTVRLAPTTQNNSSALELGVLNAGTTAYAKIDVTNTVNYDTNMRFFTNASLSTTQVERMRINSSGGLCVGTTSGPGAGNIIVNEGIYIGANNGDYQIRSSSAGGGSATLYIGNAAIQVSSDERLKTNIVDTSISALDKINQVRVVDFEWNDPTDTSYNNRNARGLWTGVIAQEIVDVFPFAVNAPRNEEDLSIDNDSENTWQLEQGALVPVLIKAIQEQQVLIEQLQARLEILENA